MKSLLALGGLLVCTYSSADFLRSEKDLSDFYKRNQEFHSKSPASPLSFEALLAPVLRLTKNVDGKEAASWSGFFVSPDGTFATTHHGLDACLDILDREELDEFSVPIDCGLLKKDGREIRFLAYYRGRTYAVKIVSHLKQRPLEERLRRAGLSEGFLIPGTFYDHLSSQDFLIGKIISEDTGKVDFVSLPSRDCDSPEELGQIFIHRPLDHGFAVGWDGKTKQAAISVGVINMEARTTNAAGNTAAPLGYLSVGWGWKEIEKRDGSNATPLHDRDLQAVPGFSGGPVFDRMGHLKGITVAADPKNGTTVLSVENLLGSYFVADKEKRVHRLKVSR